MTELMMERQSLQSLRECCIHCIRIRRTNVFILRHGSKGCA